MLQKIVNFIKYNNAFTLGVMVVFLGTGMSFAASPDLRASVYSSSEILTSVDNHLVVLTDLDNYDFNLKINTVTDDADNYYVAYSYQTLAIQDGAWENVNLNKTLKVVKSALDGKDLGLYVAEELSENINYELSYLTKVQDLEKVKGESNKTITVEYAGLVGKFIDPKEKIIEGYNPIVEEINPETNRDVVDIPGPSSSTPPESSPTLAPQGQVDEATVRRIIAEMLAEEENPSSSSGGGSSDPTPADPTPADPAPTDPAPVDPVPVEPTPTDPAPVEPVDPAPDPTLPTEVGTPTEVGADPAPVEPALVDPAPTQEETPASEPTPPTEVGAEPAPVTP